MSASARQEFSPELKQLEEQHVFSCLRERVRKVGYDLNLDPEGGYRFTGGGGLWSIRLNEIKDVKTFTLAFCATRRGEVDAAMRHVAWAAQKAGSQKALAERLGVSQSFVSDMINGRRDVPAGILKKLGLRAVVSYVWTTDV